MLQSLVLAAALFLAPSGAYASQGEFELFDRGYEYYGAYEPGKAVETFRMFLKEFPESSARDAAMFWLGKSLIQTGSVEEAKKVFSELKQQCPESPLIPYVDRETEDPGNQENRRRADKDKRERASEAVRPETVRNSELKEAERKIHLLEGELAEAVREQNRLGALLEEEKKRTSDMRTTVSGTEKKDAGSGSQSASREEKQRKAEGRDRKDVPEYERLVITIKDRKYTTEQIADFMINSSAVMAKGGIREILWRNGSLVEDFINEQILYDEAKRENVAVDTGKQQELAEKLRLSAAEAEYLKRYLSICYLIDRKVGNLPEERVVESLTVRYTERDKQDKVVLANELQEQAKAGRSFEEIYNMFPDKTRFSTVGFQELQGWIKERIELLRDGEVSVVWTKDGYMILRPVLKKASYKPFEDIRTGRKDEIRAFLREWTEELRKETRDISIVKSE